MCVVVDVHKWGAQKREILRNLAMYYKSPIFLRDEFMDFLTDLTDLKRSNRLSVIRSNGSKLHDCTRITFDEVYYPYQKPTDRIVNSLRRGSRVLIFRNGKSSRRGKVDELSVAVEGERESLLIIWRKHTARSAQYITCEQKLIGTRIRRINRSRVEIFAPLATWTF